MEEDRATPNEARRAAPSEGLVGRARTGVVLGLGDADGLEDAVSSGGLPAAVVDAIGDIARAADTNWWWLLAVGVPLLLWKS